MNSSNNENFNTEPILSEINSVLQKGLKLLLNDYFDRYNLLETTHSQIMKLPSVVRELNKVSINENDTNENDSNLFVTIEGLTQNIVKSQLQPLESRLDQMEQNINTIMPFLQTILSQIQELRKEPISKTTENIKLEIEEKEDVEEEDVEQDVEEEEEEEQEQDEEEEEEEEQEQDEEEETDVEQDDTEEDETDGKEEVEEVSKEEQEEEEQEVEVDEEDSDEVETEASVEEEEEEEEELFEIEIDDVTYCTNNEENGFIYELTEDAEVGAKVGYLKEGEPFFYADEK